MLNSTRQALTDNATHNEYIVKFNKILDCSEEFDLTEDHLLMQLSLSGLQESFGFELAYAINVCKREEMSIEDIKDKYKDLLSLRELIAKLTGKETLQLI